MPPINDPMIGPGAVRLVVARWVITADLVLESAAHMGNGEEGEAVDMPLVRDRLEEKPLLCGSSLAGGLRSYVLDRLDGYGQDERLGSAVSILFGGTRGDDEGGQSPLIVFDSVCSPPPNWTAEIRDGVAIDTETGLAQDHKKFDLEVLPAGTAFPLRFELIVADTKEEPAQLARLATALQGLEDGEIPIGARRSRGLGTCRAKSWRAKRFDLSTQPGWLAWLGSDYVNPLPAPAKNVPGKKIDQVLKEALPSLILTTRPSDARKRLLITANLVLDGGLLVRSPGTGADAADVTHLTSGGKSVLPGTSLAGVLRARALRIAYVVRNGKGDADKWVDHLFGPRLEGTTNPNFQPQASRLRVEETEIKEGKRLRPNRIKIDRFTGGVVDGALFDEEPVYRGKSQVKLELRDPQPGETGLVLLLLKDLLTGDLAVGGTSSVGRGVLEGTAKLCMNGREYTLDPSQPVDAEAVRTLNGEVKTFHDAAVLKEATA